MKSQLVGVSNPPAFVPRCRALRWLAALFFLLPGVATGQLEINQAYSDKWVVEGSSFSYTVALATRPSDTATVTPIVTNGVGVILDKTILEFTPLDWNVPQTVTVTLPEDANTSDEWIFLGHSISIAGVLLGEGAVTSDVSVWAIDNDVTGFFIKPGDRLTIQEGDAAEFEVTILRPPQESEVTVSISGHSGTDLTLDATTLNFNRVGPMASRTVTVTAGQDADALNDSATLTFTGSGNDYEGVTASLRVDTTDDDTAGLVFTPSSVALEEWGDAAYTVRLATRPTEPVTLSITGHSGTDLTLDKTFLEFMPDKWNETQTVTVSAAADEDAVNDVVPLVHAASGGDYGLVSANVVVTVTDNDMANLMVSASLEVAEGGDATYTVALATRPVGPVTVSIGGYSGTDLTLDKTSLEFMPSKWNESQTVTVSAASDDDAVNDYVTLVHAFSGGGYASVSGSVGVRVTDDDRAGVVLTPASLEVEEGGDAAYKVALATRPVGPVTVSVTGHSGADLTLDKTSLEFTPSNWNEAQTVTVSADQDDDTLNESATLTFTGSGNDYEGVTASLRVDTTDDDTPGVVFTPSSLAVTEGNDATYTVGLATRPLGPVTVYITGHSGTDLTLDKTFLEFTPSNWNEAQAVTVRAGQDDDAVNESATLVHSASGGGYGMVSAKVGVTVYDDDTAGLVFAPSSVAVTEGDHATYKIALATRPTGPVTVSVTGHSDTDLTLDKTFLEFTPLQWNVAQTVTVRAASDDDAVNESATLVHVASGGDYGSVSANVGVTVNDDDPAGLVLTPATVEMMEGDDATCTVALATQPTGPVTVSIGGYPGTNLTLDKTSLEFTPDNWNETQTVTVSAAVDDDAVDDWATLTFTGSGVEYEGVTASLRANTTDNDTAGLVVLASMTVAEGNDATYKVALATRPAGPVTVSITGNSGTDLTLGQTLLEFTPSNWKEAQTVTVKAGQDDDTLNDSATLIHAASGGDYGSVSANVGVTVNDDDTAGLVFTPSSVAVTEGDEATYKVGLATRPVGPVTVYITGYSGTDLTLDKTFLEFTPSNWNEAQTVTVRAASDDDAVNESATLVHAASGGDYNLVSANVGVTVNDDDTAGLVFTPSSVAVTEGEDAAYTIALATRPTGPVAVSITGNSGTDLTLDKTFLEFTPSSWNEAQTVTVTAGQDDDAVSYDLTLVHAASGGDYGLVSANVGVTVNDDDTAGLVFTPSSVAVTEGDDATCTVALAARPTGPVTVSIAGHSGTDLTLGQTLLEFTPSNWNEAQTVTVSVAADDDAVNDSATLTFTGSGVEYEGVTASLRVNTTDNDTAELVFTPSSIVVEEGDDAAYTVALATRPVGPVTVSIAGHSATDLMLGQASLEFTLSNWKEPQTVMVTAGQDDDTSNDSATLVHTASGGGYYSVSGNVGVKVTDDDTAGLVFTPSSIVVEEGGYATYTVALATRPTGPVTVSLAEHLSADLTMDKAVLEFTPSNWNEAQTVTVGASVDDDAANELATLAHAASGGDYGLVSGNVGVTVNDHDTAGLVFKPVSMAMEEKGDATYTVALATRPTRPVAVSITGHSGTDLTLGETLLEFTSSNWNEAQTVMVTAGQDADTSNDSATLSHAASGGEYGSVSGNVGVTVTDHDTANLVVSASVEVAEGGDATYTVGLATRPTGPVTVSITGHSGTDLTLGQTLLEFTPSNWNEARMVTVSAAADDDAVNDVVTLVHAFSGGGYTAVSGNVGVTVTDDDLAGLVFTPSSVRVIEGGYATYTVGLATRPTGPVTVSITGHAGTDLTLGQASLEFTPSNWNEAQTVTVTAGQDDDAVNKLVKLVHAASGGDYGLVSGNVGVTVTDDDTAGLVFTPSSVGVIEGGDSNYTVRLATRPTRPVTVSLGEHLSADLTLDKTFLEFTPSNWNEAQTVKVTAGQDDDAVKELATLAYAASGGDYGSVSGNLEVTVIEDDTARLVFTPSSMALIEGGDSNYTVRLATRPTGPVTVSITGHSGTELKLSQTSLEFIPLQWNEAQTVKVTAGQDDDAVKELATLVHAASGGDYGSVSGNVGVTVTDDDTTGLVFMPSSMALIEGGDSNYTVRLATRPTGPVTVSITGHSGTDLTMGQTLLEFTPSNWNEAQTVMVSADQDDDTSNDSATLVHAASGGDYGFVSGNVGVTVTDEDRAGLVVSASVIVAEGGNATYTVALATRPTGPVSVSLAEHLNADLTLDRTFLEFTPSNWNEAQTVTVSADQDDDTSNDWAALVHEASGGDYGSVSANVNVTVIDNDREGLVFTPSSMALMEGDDSIYTVGLATRPTGPVAVFIEGHSGADLTLDKTSLGFTPSKWNEVQTVTVSADQDDDTSNDSAELVHKASGGDYTSVSGSVGVTVLDDDREGLVFTPSSLAVIEGGYAAYTVALATRPIGPVTVSIAGHSGMDLTLGQTLLEFTPSNWNEAQTVTVTAGQDDDAVSYDLTLVHEATGGDYGSVSANVSVTVIDDDRTGLVVSASVTVAEGGDATYTVGLATRPTGPVTVSITGHSGTDLTLDKTFLEFTPLQWDEAQTVTVSAAAYGDAVNKLVTLIHEATGGDYGSVSTKVGVLVNDADTSNDSATLTRATSGSDYASVTADEPVTSNDAPERVFAPSSVAEGEGTTTRLRWRRGRRGR